MNAKTEHSLADIADFEAFIAGYGRGMPPGEETDIQRWLRANPGHSHREWKDGDKHSLRDDRVDPLAPEGGMARTRYVRDLATASLAHCLPLDIRREAARDPALIWNPLARRYRLRVAGDAPAGCASLVQPDDSALHPNTPPAPALADVGGALGEGVSITFSQPQSPTGGCP